MLKIYPCYHPCYNISIWIQFMKNRVLSSSTFSLMIITLGTHSNSGAISSNFFKNNLSFRFMYGYVFSHQHARTRTHYRYLIFWTRICFQTITWLKNINNTRFKLKYSYVHGLQQDEIANKYLKRTTFVIVITYRITETEAFCAISVTKFIVSLTNNVISLEIQRSKTSIIE